MPVASFVPSRIHLDYPEWQAPLIGNVGQVWAYDGTGYVPTSFLLSSAVSVYGLTLASAADAAAARTALALGTAATLNVGTSANQVVQLDGSSRLPAVDGSQLTGITVAAAGSNTQVIYNASGVYAGDAGLTYNASTDRLTVVGGLVTGDWSPPSDSTTAVSIWNAARTTRVVTVDTTNGLTKFLYMGGTGDGISIKKNHPNTGGYSICEISGTSASWTSGMGLAFYNHGTPAIVTSAEFRMLGTLTAASPVFGSTNAFAAADSLRVGVASAGNMHLYTMKYASSPYPNLNISAPAIYFRTKAGASWADGSSNALYGTLRVTMDDTGVDIVGLMRADSLRLDVTPTSETITPTHTITISLNGTNYKIPCVAA